LLSAGKTRGSIVTVFSSATRRVEKPKRPVLLQSLCRFRSSVQVAAGPAAVAFTACVLLSLFASASFDPHYLWDEPRGEA
jgi:hypothetical protein